MLVWTSVPISKPVWDFLKLLAWSLAPQSELPQLRQLSVRPLVSDLFDLKAFEHSGLEEPEGWRSIGLALFLDTTHAVLEQMTNATPARLPVILG